MLMIGALYFHLRKIPRGVFQQYFKLNLHVHVIKQCHNIHELSWVTVQCTKHKMRSCSYCPNVLTIAINRCSVSHCCYVSIAVMAAVASLPNTTMAEASSPIFCSTACSFKVLSALPQSPCSRVASFQPLLLIQKSQTKQIATSQK